MAYSQGTGYRASLKDVLPCCSSCQSQSVRLIDVKIDVDDCHGGTKPVWVCEMCQNTFAGRSTTGENIVGAVGSMIKDTTDRDTYDSYNGRVKKHEMEKMAEKLKQSMEYMREDLMIAIQDAVRRKEPETELEKLKHRVLNFELIA